MEWYIFALLAPAFWALNNVFIKFLLSKKFKSYFPMIFLIISIDAFFGFVILAFEPIAFLYPYSFFALIVGMIPLLGFWFYSKALIREEVSRIVTLFQFIPVFVAFFSVIFLNEFLSGQKYLGIFLIVGASLLISYKKSAGAKSFSGALRFMIPFCITIAVYAILEKYLLNYLDFWSVFFWNVLGAFLGVLFMFCFSKPRREITDRISVVGRKAIILTFVGEGLYVLGTISSLLAMSLVDVSLASALFGLQPFYVFFYMLVLSVFMPKILKEELNRSILAFKIIAITLMFAGTWLVV